MPDQLGAQVIGMSLMDIGRTADEFKVLEARSDLATSKSGNFAEAFEGVKNIAIETRSNLTATAELFTRVKSATDQLGYSQEVNTQAVKLSTVKVITCSMIFLRWIEPRAVLLSKRSMLQWIQRTPML